MRPVVCVCLLLFAVSVFAAKPVSSTPACASFQKAVASGTQGQRLKKFFDVQWAYWMNEYPEWATYVGYPGLNDKWSDRSLEAFARRDKELVCQLNALKKIDPKRLADVERTNYELSRRRVELDIEGQEFDSKYLVLDHMGGLHMDLPDTLFSMPKTTVKDFQNMIARLEKVPELEAQTEILLREGAKKKITPVKMFLERVPKQFDQILTEKIEDGPMWEVFKSMELIPEGEREGLRQKARAALQDKVYPALQKLRAYLEKDYIPQARESTAWSEMPNGKRWYAYRVKYQTTTSKTAAELHELGLREVDRITKEMEKIKDQLKFRGDLKAFNTFLLRDSQFFYRDPKDLMTAYRELAKRIDPELPRLFKKLPRLTYGVREMPLFKAPNSPAAYYQPGSPDAGRAGFFEANTYDLKARPIWAMECLTMHEAVPGHHLQIAISQEIEGLPEFRKNDGYTAFVEGWGLYAESLGYQLGFYKDPYSAYGQLSYELWRAVRLVVDTGMHELGWSREKALDYFMTLLPKSRSESEVEIDRYITWPGQALAYKVGQLKILELRQKAEAALGEKFDIRLFHDEILRHGAVPLDVLEKLFNEWLTKQSKPTTKAKAASPKNH